MPPGLRESPSLQNKQLMSTSHCRIVRLADFNVTEAQFDDDKKEMLFDTPAGNKILISEDQKGITLQDQNGNKIVMNDSGIEITSSKDFKVSATGDIKMEGVNAEISANAQYKASGNGGAELSSSAMTSVKGSMVNIN